MMKTERSESSDVLAAHGLRPVSRRLALLQRIGLFTERTQGATIRRATTIEDITGAFSLVHDLFVKCGYIQAKPTGLRIRAHEALPDTATFIAVAEGQVVGVQSVVPDDPIIGLPSDGSFKDILDGLRNSGHRIAEASNEAIAEAYRKSGVPTELMRACVAQAISMGCTDLVTAVSAGHSAFFEVFGAVQVGDERSFSKEINDPVVIMRLDLTCATPGSYMRPDITPDLAFGIWFGFESNPYMNSLATWAIVARRMFEDPTLVTEMFVNRANLLATCSERELAAIRRAWGDSVYEAVMASSTIADPLKLSA